MCLHSTDTHFLLRIVIYVNDHFLQHSAEGDPDNDLLNDRVSTKLLPIIIVHRDVVHGLRWYWNRMRQYGMDGGEEDKSTTMLDI